MGLPDIGFSAVPKQGQKHHFAKWFRPGYEDLAAEIAQLVELLICNQVVAGSNPVLGSLFLSGGSNALVDCSRFNVSHGLRFR